MATKIVIKPNPAYNKFNQQIRLEEKTITALEGEDIETRSNDVSVAYTRTPKAKFYVSFPMSRTLNGNLHTGDLLKPAHNPFDDEPNYKDDRFEDALKGQERAKLQYILEYKHNKPFDFYSNQMPSKVERTSKFPALAGPDYRFNLRDGDTVLTLSTERDEMCYYCCKAHNLIANSFGEMTDRHAFYIAQEEEESSTKIRKVIEKDKAIASLYEMHRSKTDILIPMAKAMNIPGRPTTSEKAYLELKEYIQKPKTTDRAKHFNNLYEMYNNKSRKAEFQARVTLNDAMHFGIVTLRGSSYTWHPPSEYYTDPKDKSTKIDSTERSFDRFDGENSIIEFLTSKKWQPEQKAINEQIKVKQTVY